MSETSHDTSAFSLARLLKLLLPVLAIALAVRMLIPGYEQAAQQQLEANMLTKLLGTRFEAPSQAIDFKDEDGDLLCDSPAADACVTPEKLVFSYVGGPEEVDESETWADLVTALGEATGLPCEYQHYASVSDQISAVISGEAQVVGLNTGAIPTAVESAGFHPVCTLGKADGSFGYKMKLLAPADGITDVAGLSGKRIAYTTPSSNSGFKAALVYLMNEQDLKPERDYQWGWTYAHETSVKALLEGEYDAAPIASDILERMINDGEVDADKITVIYESERFPPATIGYAHNLASELREKIAATLLGFDWGGTSVEAKYGSAGLEAFAPVTYKDDWANIRRIDSTVASAKAGKK